MRGAPCLESRAREPRSHPVATPPVALAAAVDESTPRASGQREVGVQPLQKVAADRFRRLDLDRNPMVARIDHEINLTAVRVPPEVERRTLPVVQVELAHLTHDEGLEDRAPQRVMLEVVRAANAQQPAQQPGVGEVELGALDQTFSKCGWRTSTT
jgi:hypothetical protein